MYSECILKKLKYSLTRERAAQVTEKEYRNICIEFQTFFSKHADGVLWKNSSDVSKNLIIDVISKACEFGFLPNYNGPDELEHEVNLAFSKSDWGILTLSVVTDAISWLIHEGICKDDFHFVDRLVVPVFILCYTHSMEEQWASSASKEKAVDLVKLFGKFYFKETGISPKDFVNGVFSKPQKIFKLILSFLQPILTRDNWRKNSSYKRIFYFTLFHIPPDLVSLNHDKLIPPSLLFVDDYNTRNQILGIKCLHCIIHHVSGAELRLNGKADVIYSALLKLSYRKEADLVDAIHPCIIDIIAVIDPPKDKYCIWTKYDSLFNRLLIDMEMEQRLVLRKSYSQQVPIYVDCMGIHTVKHMKRLMSVFYKYLEVYEGSNEPTRKNMLRALHKVLSSSWSHHFIFNHIEELLKALLKLMYDIDDHESSEQVKSELTQLLSMCIKHLQRIDYDKFTSICSYIDFKRMPSTFNSRWNICLKVPES